MLIILKIIHLLALMAGATAAIGNGIWVTRLIARGGPPPEMVPDYLATTARMGRWAIVLLWVTGIGMVGLIHGSFAMGLMFYVKLLAATGILGLLMYMGALGKRAAAAGVPPDMAKIKKLGRISSMLLLIAVVCAVVVFN